MSTRTVLVTGGAGFIGSNFVRHVLEKTEDRVVVIDKLTYAGNLESLKSLPRERDFVFVKGDIGDQKGVLGLLETHRPWAIVNFAAETHVDRSIDDPRPFVETNVVGTQQLLEAARRYWSGADKQAKEGFRLLHVSTDEVYGSLGESGLFSETTPYQPNSPYAASKAAADHLVRAYHATYGLPVLLTNCSNNYGPYQFPEKLVPLVILNALEGRDLPIYGDGQNVRDWLFVEDHCEGIALVLRAGRLGERYNIGGRNERTNREVVDRICGVLERLRPAGGNAALKARGLERYEALQTFVKDRPGHDRRYAIDASKIQKELGWTPAHDFESGLEATVAWYLGHPSWAEHVQSGSYRRERLGLGRP
jgi:dTDP-glucose 4,6-dehydratase